MSRFLADENFPGQAVKRLREFGHDLAWVREDNPGTADNIILARAVSEERIVLTFDKDFGEMAFRLGLAAGCGVVLFRMPMSPPSPAIDRVVSVLQSRHDWAGHFSVVELHRIRMRAMR